MPGSKVLLVEDNPEMRRIIVEVVLRPRGYDCLVAEDGPTGLAMARQSMPDVVITDMDLPGLSGLDLIRQLHAESPHLPMIMTTAGGSQELAAEAFRSGALDYLPKPFDVEAMTAAIERGLAEGCRRQAAARLQTELEMTNEVLGGRLRELESLATVGRAVTSVLDLNQVLTQVVAAAVNLTGAEEGSLLLEDETTGALTMRAAKNFDEEFVRTFRLESHDSLAGQVMRTGKPILLGQDGPQKIKTAYLVHSLIYVPLNMRQRCVGVLGVDNRRSDRQLNEYDRRMLTALADYATIALENARLYSRAEEERGKLEAILKQTEDGVIVVDRDDRLILVNRAARAAFGIDGQDMAGRPLPEVFPNPALAKLFQSGNGAVAVLHAEIPLDDGRTFNAQLTPIEGVGRAMVMQDITRLKEMDRIKSEFVTAVSHDLRSPLTTILGYVELIHRVGPVTAQQTDCIEHIKSSVQSITALITDLLDLGKIEAGFDTQKEPVDLADVVRPAVEAVRLRAEAKRHALNLHLTPSLPKVLGNATRLGQLVSNLIDNAIKYTSPGGHINVALLSTGHQVIVTVADNGPGIPLAEQSLVFDKFYRSPHAQDSQPGSGLGLSLVKSIAENHGGRVWLESQVGRGSTFTVVLPAIRE